MDHRLLQRGGPAFLLCALACDELIDATREAEPQPSAGQTDQSDAASAEPVRAATGLDQRPSNPTCLAFKRPPPPAAVKFIDAFPGFRFRTSTKLLEAPGDPSRFYVVQRGDGAFQQPVKIRSIAKALVPAADGGAPTFQVDDFATVSVNPAGEGGLLGMAFHPRWPIDPTVYVSYTRTFQAGVDAPPPAPMPNVGLTSVVARLTSADGGRTAGNPVEILTLARPYSNHAGGDIAFGPDGFLYIGFGDGGYGGDPHGTGQDLSTWHAKMLRIDVNTRPFVVPATNPFFSWPGSVRKEIYALGFRNPFRWSFDRESGELWLGDVGQATWEEIDHVRAGGNYGWRTCEGFHRQGSTKNLCATPGYADPVVAHGRSDAVTIIGGVFYRGRSIPGLAGTYVYGDFGTGNVWGLSVDPRGRGVSRLLVSGVPTIVSYWADTAGEVYALKINGTILKLVADGAGSGPPTIPEKLSMTGCVVPATPSRPAPGLIPFGVRSPLWADGAEKERYLAVPDGTTVHVEPDGDLSFPVGTVLMKTFRDGVAPVETRLLMRHEDGGWAGYTYEWDDLGADATLLAGAKVRSLPGGRQWTFPSRGQCLQCHTEAAGFSLGLEVAQLNDDLVYRSTNRISNQLATLEHIGLLDTPLGNPSALPSLPMPLGPDPLEQRARSYLHANCAHCHRPQANNGRLDLRFATSFAGTALCDKAPEHGLLGPPDAKLFFPGAPTKSILPLRMRAVDVTQMPPLAVRVPDGEGIALLEDWISATKACP